MVDYSSLENYRTERYRGFESLSLRKEFSISLDFFLFVLSFHLDGIEKNCIFAVDNTTENNEETIIANSYRSADANH